MTVITNSQDRIQFVPHTAIARHPRNMRKHYPQAQVEAMAQSIAGRGVLQPLIVVPVNNPSCSFVPLVDVPIYHAVIGNLRLSALYHLGHRAPLAPVIVRDISLTDQLLDMAAENSIRYNPDPISEARHYQYLLDLGMTKSRICKETGVSFQNVQNRLLWLQTEPEIQDLVAAGSLPKHCVSDLLRLPAGEVRIKAARKAASKNLPLSTITRLCTRILAQLQESGQLQPHNGKTGPGSIVVNSESETTTTTPAQIVQSLLANQYPQNRQPAPGLIRSAARDACNLCPNSNTLGVPEPAWTILSHGARHACENCGLAELRSHCGDCPLYIALRHAYRQVVRDQGQEVPHVRF